MEENVIYESDVFSIETNLSEILGILHFCVQGKRPPRHTRPAEKEKLEISLSEPTPPVPYDETGLSDEEDSAFTPKIEKREAKSKKISENLLDALEAPQLARHLKKKEQNISLMTTTTTLTISSQNSENRDANISPTVSDDETSPVKPRVLDYDLEDLQLSSPPEPKPSRPVRKTTLNKKQPAPEKKQDVKKRQVNKIKEGQNVKPPENPNMPQRVDQEPNEKKRKRGHYVQYKYS